jgi:hypothetical protein
MCVWGGSVGQWVCENAYATLHMCACMYLFVCVSVRVDVFGTCAEELLSVSNLAVSEDGFSGTGGLVQLACSQCWGAHQYEHSLPVLHGTAAPSGTNSSSSSSCSSWGIKGHQAGRS